MRYARQVAAALVLMSCAGCAPRFYPLCVFGPDPRVPSLNALVKRTEAFVRGIVGEDARVAISPNERMVVVETHFAGHEALAKVWPSAACIGQTRYDEEYLKYKTCVYLVREALKNEGIPSPGKWSDGLGNGTVYCGHPLGAVEAKPAENAEAKPLDSLNEGRPK